MNDGLPDGNANGAGRVGERRICQTKPRRAVDVMWKTGKTWAGKKITKQESFVSVVANQDKLENSKETEKDAQLTQGLSRKGTRYRGSVSSLSRVINYFFMI